MSEYEFTTEDLAAMGREGTRKEFILMLRRPSAGPVRDANSKVSAEMPADHTPGAWPIGMVPTDASASTRATCSCARCHAYTQNQPAPDELLRRAEQYLNDNPQETP